MYKLLKEKREIATAVLGLSVAIVLWITIFTRDGVIDGNIRYQPFQSFVSFWDDIKRRGIRGNFLGNILIFIPIGLLYPLSFGSNAGNSVKRFSGTVVFGLCLSLLVEMTQLLSGRGHFDIDDLILNTMGTGLGYCLYQLLSQIISVGMNKNDRF